MRLLQLRVCVCDGRSLIGNRLLLLLAGRAKAVWVQASLRRGGSPQSLTRELGGKGATYHQRLVAPMQLSVVEVEPPLPARKANSKAGTAEARHASHLHTKHGEEVRRGCEASHHGCSAVEAHGAEHRGAARAWMGRGLVQRTTWPTLKSDLRI